MGSRLAHQFFEKRYIYETQGGRILIRLLVILKNFMSAWLILVSRTDFNNNT